MTNKFNFDELKNANRLPSPSGTALRIMQCLESDNVTIKAIADLVKADPALSAKVIKFTNSAGFYNQNAILNVSDAILMMGMMKMKNFALSMSLISNKTLMQCARFNYEDFWAFSLARAVALAFLNQRELILDVEEAFTFGLLVDVGRLAMACAWAENYQICLVNSPTDVELKVQENHYFGIHHDDMTLLLLKDWGFSRFFVDAAASYFEDQIIEGSLAEQLKIAHKLASFCTAQKEERIELKNELNVLFTDEELKNLLLEWAEWGKLVDIKIGIPHSDTFLKK